MSLAYSASAIPESEIPRASDPIFQHVLDTYAGETNKVVSVWHAFLPVDMAFSPHARSRSVQEVMKHQLLSERRFFGEFLGLPEPAPGQVLPGGDSPDEYAGRLRDLAVPRLGILAERDRQWWLERVSFFDVERERIWIFWRRLLHTAHHRTQLTLYLRLLDRMVPATYGPTADVTWSGADPTNTQDAAGRK